MRANIVGAAFAQKFEGLKRREMDAKADVGATKRKPELNQLKAYDEICCVAPVACIEE
jgi:hypothetical protein